MFGIDPEISALPVTIAGQNMIRLVNCRICSYCMIAKLEGECCKQENRSRYEENLFVQVVGSKLLDWHVGDCLSTKAQPSIFMAHLQVSFLAVKFSSLSCRGAARI